MDSRFGCSFLNTFVIFRYSFSSSFDVAHIHLFFLNCGLFVSVSDGNMNLFYPIFSCIGSGAL